LRILEQHGSGVQAIIIVLLGPGSKPKPLTTFRLSSYIYGSFSTGRASAEIAACLKKTNREYRTVAGRQFACHKEVLKSAAFIFIICLDRMIRRIINGY
jgi:hypothetical protein